MQYDNIDLSFENIYVDCNNSKVSLIYIPLNMGVNNNDVPYFAINFPIDTCLGCGYSDDIADECPICHSTNIEHLARVTG